MAWLYSSIQLSEKVLIRIILILFLLDWILRGLSGMWLHHFTGVPFSIPGTDAFYWILHFTGFPLWVLQQSYVLWTIDTLLLLLPIWLFIHYRRGAMIAFFLLLVSYYVLSNSGLGSHYYSLNGFLLFFFCFCFHSTSSFGVVYDGLRYYNLYIYTCAGLWKLCRGLWTYSGQLSHIVQYDNFIPEPDKSTSWYMPVYNTLISQLIVGDMLLRMAIVAQLSSCIGFFTKKYDRLLFLILLSFHVGNYLTMRVFSFEIAVLSLTLVFRINSYTKDSSQLE